MALSNYPKPGLKNPHYLFSNMGTVKFKMTTLCFLNILKNGKISILIVYLDDIILIGNNMHEMKILKQPMTKKFEIKDLGVLRYFLGIEVARSWRGIFLSQRKYVLDLLKEVGMTGCKPNDTWIEPNHRLGACVESNKPIDNGWSQRLGRKLIYISHTKPNIAFVVSVVSQYMHSPSKAHMEVVFKILRNLKATLGKDLLFSKTDHLQVEAYTNAN